MTISKAIQRIGWRFSEMKNFTPNENDAKAFNTLVDWINNEKEKDINNNSLFAKLYILKLHEMLVHYNADIFDPIPQKELSRILSMNLDCFYKSFHRSLNESGLYSRFKGENINLNKFPIPVTQKEIKGCQRALKKDLDFLDKEVFTMEDVKKSLNIMITEALNRFR